MSQQAQTQLVWFRNDLRCADNPALLEAMQSPERGVTVAVFCLCPSQWRSHDVGDRRLAFLLRSVNKLAEGLDKLNVPIKLLHTERFDDVPGALSQLACELATTRLLANAEYPLNERRRDQAVERAMGQVDVETCWFDGSVTQPPGSVLTGDSRPYTVYTPFRKRWGEHVSIAAIAELPAPEAQRKTDIDSDGIPTSIDNVPVDLDATRWPAGEASAREALELFIENRAMLYKDQRDLPAVAGTSVLSHHLSVGSISPNACLRAAVEANGGRFIGDNDGLNQWVNEMVWREFYRHIMAQFDHVSMGHNFRREYDDVPWRDAPDELAAWQRGETGYPLVDAAMRCLNETGFMHNRLRMVAAMFLTKHLLIDWRQGERYFMQQLIDGDFASNNGGWQWSASTGTDASPYFRIFNPASQGKKFDGEGAFTRQWVPELASVPKKILFEASRRDGLDYPEPIVDHKLARERALDAFKNR